MRNIYIIWCMTYILCVMHVMALWWVRFWNDVLFNMMRFSILSMVYDDECYIEHAIWWCCYKLVTREGLEGVWAPLRTHTRTCVLCVGTYYTSIVVRDWRTPLDEIGICLKSMITCVCICMAPYSAVTYWVFFKILRSLVRTMTTPQADTVARA